MHTSKTNHQSFSQDGNFTFVSIYFKLFPPIHEVPLTTMGVESLKDKGRLSNAIQYCSLWIYVLCLFCHWHI